MKTLLIALAAVLLITGMCRILPQFRTSAGSTPTGNNEEQPGERRRADVPNSEDTTSTAGSDSAPFQTPVLPVADGKPGFIIDSNISLKSLLENEGHPARTEPSFAYALASELFKCHRFDEWVASAAADSPDGRNSEFARGAAQRCAGLSTQDTWKYLEYLDYAARMGDTDARIFYAAAGSRAIFDHRYALQHPEEIIRHKQTAMSYLNESARTGSAVAMRELAFAFDAGVLAQHNRVNAVAMFSAAQRRQPIPYGAGVLEKWSALLTPAELARANQLADAFLQDCCGGP